MSTQSLRDLHFEFSTRSTVGRWAPVPLGLIVGFGFLQHGFTKLDKGAAAFAALLNALGVPGPYFMARPPTGLCARYGFSSIKLIAVRASGAQFGQPRYECDLLYLAGLAALALGGSGPLAIDSLVRKQGTTNGNNP